MWRGLFLDQDYPTTGFTSFFTLEISVSLEFVQMVFHTIRSQIKNRSQSLTGQVWILGEQVQNLLGGLTYGLLGSGKLLLGSLLGSILALLGSLLGSVFRLRCGFLVNDALEIRIRLAIEDTVHRGEEGRGV